MSGTASGNGPGRAGDALLVGATSLATLALLSQLLLYGYGRDQGIYDVVARTVASGGAPYRDAWDFKPPGVYFVYAAAGAVFGPAPRAIRMLEAAALLSLFVVFPLLSRRFLGCARAGWLAAFTGVLAYVPLEYWDTAQPEGFGGVLLAWALLCATVPLSAGAARRFASLALAGGLYCLAGLMKPPLAGGAALSCAFLLAERRADASRARRAGDAAAGALAVASGAAVVLAGTLAFFASRDALGDLREVLLGFAPAYTALGHAEAGPAARGGRALADWLFAYAPYSLPGLLCLVLLPPAAPREREGALHVLGVIGVVLLGVALQAKFFLYHYAAAALLTGLPAGWGYWKLWVRVRGSRAALLLTAAALAGVWWLGLPGTSHLEAFWRRARVRVAALGGEHWTVVNDRLHSSGDVDAGAIRRAGAWLRENTPPRSSLYVWGFYPSLYVEADRRPASRYIYNVPQRATWSREQARRRLMDDLSRDPPAVIVVARDDVLPWVIGNRRDSASELLSFEPLRLLVDHDYAEAGRFGNLTLYRRVRP